MDTSPSSRESPRVCINSSYTGDTFEGSLDLLDLLSPLFPTACFVENANWTSLSLLH
jgi:hypothetical protein